MARRKSFPSTYENACKLIAASHKVVESYKCVHFWEHPNECVEESQWYLKNCKLIEFIHCRNTFNAKLCRELNMPPTPKSVQQILIVVNQWNVHKVLKALYKGTIVQVSPKLEVLKLKNNWSSLFWILFN